MDLPDAAWTAAEAAISELFHENSKQARNDQRVVERIVAAASNPYLLRLGGARKRYPSVPRIPLPAPLVFSAELARVLLTRRSHHDFSGATLELAEVATLVALATGQTGELEGPHGHRQPLRAAPSAGALYPVETYLFALRVEGIHPGLYKYDPLDHELQEVGRGAHAAALALATHIEELTAAAAVIAFTGVPLKTKLKYGERGYRFLLLEAGHLAQNLMLVATALGLPALPIGGFVDNEVDRLLGIDGLDEISLYLLAVGGGARPQT